MWDWQQKSSIRLIILMQTTAFQAKNLWLSPTSKSGISISVIWVTHRKNLETVVCVPEAARYDHLATKTGQLAIKMITTSNKTHNTLHSKTPQLSHIRWIPLSQFTKLKHSYLNWYSERKQPTQLRSRQPSFPSQVALGKWRVLGVNPTTAGLGKVTSHGLVITHIIHTKEIT